MSIPSSGDSHSEHPNRPRPPRFSSTWKEIAFVSSIATSQLLTEYFLGGFTILLPTVAMDLNIASTSTTWPASVSSMTIAAFLLPFGRLADMWGGPWVYLAGLTWFAMISLAIGFASNDIVLIVLRAFQGLGPAAYLPAGLQLLGNAYGPGPRKNLVFFIYGGMASFGFFVGMFFAGICGEFMNWRWYFWLGTVLAAALVAVSIVAIPRRPRTTEADEVIMDWWGSGFMASGLILTLFAITYSSHAHDGWRSPYTLIAFLLGMGSLAITFYVEGWVAQQPLLPFDLFASSGTLPFTIGLLFAYGPLGIYLLYATLL